LAEPKYILSCFFSTSNLNSYKSF